MLIGGILLMVTNNVIEHGAREFINHNGDAIVQAELSTMTRIIQSDLRKAGYGIDEADQSTIMQHIDAGHFACLTRPDLEIEVPDTVEYLISLSDSFTIIDASIVFYAVDRIVKKAGEDPQTTRIGNITNTDVFRYLDQSGRETNIPQAVDIVEVTLISINRNIYLDNSILLAVSAIERKKEMKKLAKESYWRQSRVISRNLRR